MVTFSDSLVLGAVFAGSDVAVPGEDMFFWGNFIYDFATDNNDILQNIVEFLLTCDSTTECNGRVWNWYLWWLSKYLCRNEICDVNSCDVANECNDVECGTGICGVNDK